MNDTNNYDELSGRICDGQPVNWRAANSRSDLDPELVGQLEALSKITERTLRLEDADFRVRLKDRYRIVDRLGAGGMGEVYVALREHLGDLVAIKMLPISFSAEEEARARLKKEAQILAQIKHPNVAQIHDLDEHEGRDFIVMELVNGETLRQRLVENGPMSEREAIELALQMLAGLGEAHANQVIHRDLKPENLIVTPEGNLKILDFGIAKDTAFDAAAAQSMNTIAGTAPYMAPEQILGKRVDQRTDLYTVGVILSELATGERPYQIDKDGSVVEAILSAKPIAIRNRVPELSAELEAIIQRLLSKEPSQRYSSTRELGDALREIYSDRYGEVWVVQSSPARSSTGRRLAVGVVLLATILAIGKFLWTNPGSVDEVDDSTIAVFPFTIRGDESIAYLGEGMVDLLHASLDGAGEFRSVSPATVVSALGDRTEPLDPSAGAEVARSLHAGHYVLGSIVRVGDELRITATLHGKRGESEQTSLGMASTTSELPAAIDALAADLLRGRVSEADLPPGIDTNLLALQAYLDGQRSLRSGSWKQAVEDFERSVAADSTFAYAYSKLVVAYSMQHESVEVTSALEHALRSKEQLSERMATMLELVDKWLYEISAATRSQLSDLANKYPDDAMTWYMLGDYDLHNGPLLGYSRTTSIEAMNKAFDIVIVENDWLLLFHERVLAAEQGDFEEYGRILRRLNDISPEGIYADWVRFELAILERDGDQRRSILDRFQSSPDFILANVLNVTSGAMAENMMDLDAVRELAEILEAPQRNDSARFQGILANVTADAAEGKFRAARSKLAAAHDLDDDYALEYEGFIALAAFLRPDLDSGMGSLRESLLAWHPASPPEGWQIEANLTTDPHSGLHGDLRTYLLGLLSAHAGDVAAAELYAETLDEGAHSDPTRTLAAGIRAEILVRAGRPAEAAELLRPPAMRFDIVLTHFSPFLGRTRERFLMAEALRAEGKLEEALAWYDVASLQSTYDVIYRAPCHLRQAEIYEELGNKEAAIQNYRRFLDLWSDCDPELQPAVATARAAVHRLGGGS